MLHAPNALRPCPFVAFRVLSEVGLAHRRAHAIRERRKTSVLVTDEIRHLVRTHDVQIRKLPVLDSVLPVAGHLFIGEVVHDKEHFSVKSCPFRCLVHERRERRAEAIHVIDKRVEHRVSIVVAHDRLLENRIHKAVDDDAREVRIACLLSSDIEIPYVLALVTKEIRTVEKSSRARIGVIQEVVVPIRHRICQNRHAATSYQNTCCRPTCGTKTCAMSSFKA